MAINVPLLQLCRSIDPNCALVSEDIPAEYYTQSRKLGYSGSGMKYASVSRWGECIRMNCPTCGDTKQHLFICHLAGAKAYVKGRRTPLQFSQFLCVCHRRHCNRENPEFKKWLSSLKLFDLPALDLRNDALIKKKSGSPYGICADMDDILPNPTYPLLSTNTPAYVIDWLVNERRQDPTYLQDVYGVGFAPAGATYENRNAPKGERLRRTLDDRLIVPWVQGRSLVGWQGRIPRTHTGSKAKYLSTPNCQKTKVLYNLNRAMFQSTVVLVEGVFDAWRIGDCGVAMFGHTLSPDQMLQLKAVYGRNGGIIVMLDAQSSKEPHLNDIAVRMANDLMEIGAAPRGAFAVCLDDGKDPDDRTPGELAHILHQAMGRLAPPIKGVTPEHDLENLTRGFAELEAG